MSQHPIQPLAPDKHGVIRFKKNEIVCFLLSAGRFDMNSLQRMSFSDEDRVQFAQLIGYSQSGFEELSYVSGADVARVEQVNRYVTALKAISLQRCIYERIGVSPCPSEQGGRCDRCLAVEALK